MHPDQVLFQGERPLPQMPAIDHYAGSEKLIAKALTLQQSLGPVFDITCDCEDGAKAGEESRHAQMAADMVMSADNRFERVGARIHDITHPHWQEDVEILVKSAGSRLAFLTLPKPRCVEDVSIQLGFIRDQQRYGGQQHPIPVHVLIETHGALRDVWQIAALDGVESIDFGLMDFVSAHHGAIPGEAMRSPGQFEHPLIVRAKCEIAAAALANGAIPSHNVTTELKDAEYIHRDALRARKEFGYLRMWSIHPNQIQPILAAMQPDFSEVAEAEAILCAAADAHWGPIRHADKLHDRASYRYYWTLLKRAHATGVPLPDPVRERFFK
jgi:citrate lyase subunit beta/citryl-CoA lyase